MKSKEKLIELKPVVPMKRLHECVRNVLANDVGINKASLLAMAEKRIDDVIASNLKTIVTSLIQGKVATATGKYYTTDSLQALINESIVKQLDQMVGQAIREVASRELKKIVVREIETS